jgi:transposase-like protein
MKFQSYECDVCHKKFTTKESMRNHARIHTGERVS